MQTLPRRASRDPRSRKKPLPFNVYFGGANTHMSEKMRHEHLQHRVLLQRKRNQTGLRSKKCGMRRGRSLYGSRGQPKKKNNEWGMTKAREEQKASKKNQQSEVSFTKRNFERIFLAIKKSEHRFHIIGILNDLLSPRPKLDMQQLVRVLDGKGGKGGAKTKNENVGRVSSEIGKIESGGVKNVENEDESETKSDGIVVEREEKLEIRNEGVCLEIREKRAKIVDFRDETTDIPGQNKKSKIYNTEQENQHIRPNSPNCSNHPNSRNEINIQANVNLKGVHASSRQITKIPARQFETRNSRAQSRPREPNPLQKSIPISDPAEEFPNDFESIQSQDSLMMSPVRNSLALSRQLSGKKIYPILEKNLGGEEIENQNKNKRDFRLGKSKDLLERKNREVSAKGEKDLVKGGLSRSEKMKRSRNQSRGRADIQDRKNVKKMKNIQDVQDVQNVQNKQSVKIIKNMKTETHLQKKIQRESLSKKTFLQKKKISRNYSTERKKKKKRKLKLKMAKQKAIDSQKIKEESRESVSHSRKSKQNDEMAQSGSLGPAIEGLIRSKSCLTQGKDWKPRTSFRKYLRQSMAPGDSDITAVKGRKVVNKSDKAEVNSRKGVISNKDRNGLGNNTNTVNNMKDEFVKIGKMGNRARSIKKNMKIKNQVKKPSKSWVKHKKPVSESMKINPKHDIKNQNSKDENKEILKDRSPKTEMRKLPNRGKSGEAILKKRVKMCKKSDSGSRKTSVKKKQGFEDEIRKVMDDLEDVDRLLSSIPKQKNRSQSRNKVSGFGGQTRASFRTQSQEQCLRGAGITGSPPRGGSSGKEVREPSRRVRIKLKLKDKRDHFKEKKRKRNHGKHSVSPGVSLRNGPSQRASNSPSPNLAKKVANKSKNRSQSGTQTSEHVKIMENARNIENIENIKNSRAQKPLEWSSGPSYNRKYYPQNMKFQDSKNEENNQNKSNFKPSHPVQMTFSEMGKKMNLIQKTEQTPQNLNSRVPPHMTLTELHQNCSKDYSSQTQLKMRDLPETNSEAVYSLKNLGQLESLYGPSMESGEWPRDLMAIQCNQADLAALESSRSQIIRESFQLSVLRSQMMQESKVVKLSRLGPSPGLIGGRRVEQNPSQQTVNPNPCERRSRASIPQKPKKSFFKKLHSDKVTSCTPHIPSKIDASIPKIAPLPHGRLEQLILEPNLRNADLHSLKSLETMGSVYQSINSKRPLYQNPNDTLEVSIYRKNPGQTAVTEEQLQMKSQMQVKTKTQTQNRNMSRNWKQNNNTNNINYSSAKDSVLRHGYRSVPNQIQGLQLDEKFKGLKDTPVHRDFTVKHFSTNMGHQSHYHSRERPKIPNPGDPSLMFPVNPANIIQADPRSTQFPDEVFKKSKPNINPGTERMRNTSNERVQKFSSQVRSVRERSGRLSHAKPMRGSGKPVSSHIKPMCAQMQRSQRKMGSLRNLPESVFCLQSQTMHKQKVGKKSVTLNMQSRKGGARRGSQQGLKKGTSLYDRPAGKGSGGYRGRGSRKQRSLMGVVKIQFNP